MKMKHYKKILFLIVISIIFITYSCSREKNKQIKKIEISLFIDKIKVIKDISIRDRVPLNNKTKIIGTAISNEVFKVIDILPRAFKVYQYEERQGWVFVYGRTNYYKATGKDKIFILHNILMYESKEKKKQLGLVRKGAEYKVLDIEAMYYKIRLDNGKEGWIYAGKKETPWVMRIGEKKSVIEEEQDEMGEVKRGELILWNKLGSDVEVKNSEIGPNGSIVGTMIYDNVKFNDGMGNADANSYVEFGNNCFDGRKGTIEFWFKTKFNVVNGVGVNIEIQRWWFTQYTSGDGYVFAYFDDYAHGSLFKIGIGKNHFIILSPNCSWTSNTIHHFAVTFDRTGIGDTGKTIIVYLDGEAIASSNEIWDEFGTTYGEFVVLNAVYSTGGLHKSLTYIDNLKIWDYAKTNFDDRFTE